MEEIFHSSSFIKHIAIHEHLAGYFLTLNKNISAVTNSRICVIYLKLFPESSQQTIVETKEGTIQEKRNHLQFDLDVFCMCLGTQQNINIILNIIIKNNFNQRQALHL